MWVSLPSSARLSPRLLLPAFVRVNQLSSSSLLVSLRVMYSPHTFLFNLTLHRSLANCSSSSITNNRHSQCSHLPYSTFSDAAALNLNFLFNLFISFLTSLTARALATRGAVFAFGSIAQPLTTARGPCRLILKVERRVQLPNKPQLYYFQLLFLSIFLSSSSCLLHSQIAHHGLTCNLPSVEDRCRHHRHAQFHRHGCLLRSLGYLRIRKWEPSTFTCLGELVFDCHQRGILYHLLVLGLRERWSTAPVYSSLLPVWAINLNVVHSPGPGSFGTIVPTRGAWVPGLFLRRL